MLTAGLRWELELNVIAIIDYSPRVQLESPPESPPSTEQRLIDDTDCRIAVHAVAQAALRAHLARAVLQVEGEPPLVLRGFQKTRVLLPGEKSTVDFVLDVERDLAIWEGSVSDDTGRWRPVAGSFEAATNLDGSHLSTAGARMQTSGPQRQIHNVSSGSRHIVRRWQEMAGDGRRSNPAIVTLRTACVTASSWAPPPPHWTRIVPVGRTSAAAARPTPPLGQ